MTKKKKKSRSQYWTSTGKKRYLKRDKKGRIVDNQSYKKSSAIDQTLRAIGE